MGVRDGPLGRWAAVYRCAAGSGNFGSQKNNIVLKNTDQPEVRREGASGGKWERRKQLWNVWQKITLCCRALAGAQRVRHLVIEGSSQFQSSEREDYEHTSI